MENAPHPRRHPEKHCHAAAFCRDQRSARHSTIRLHRARDAVHATASSARLEPRGPPTAGSRPGMAALQYRCRILRGGTRNAAGRAGKPADPRLHASPFSRPAPSPCAPERGRVADRVGGSAVAVTKRISRDSAIRSRTRHPPRRRRRDPPDRRRQDQGPAA